MGTGFSLDPNEYRAAANVIEGYGSQQADHGAALASGTSTPLSSSNSGIAGAISAIAQGTVQKIVTDVTSTTQNFANDTANGLRTQANNADHLESNISSNLNSVLAGAGTALPGALGLAGVGSLVGGSGGSGGGSLPSFAGAGTGVGAGGIGAGGGSAGLITDAAPTSTAPLGDAANTSELGTLGANESESGNLGSVTGSGAAAESEAGASAAGESAGLEGGQESSMMQMGQEMRGAARGGGAGGGGEERGQRPGYLKQKAEQPVKSGADPMKTAAAEHQKTCGVAPIPFAAGRLVCAKCGTVIEVGEGQEIAA